jgi:hypothetical protein
VTNRLQILRDATEDQPLEPSASRDDRADVARMMRTALRMAANDARLRCHVCGQPATRNDQRCNRCRE